MSLEPWPTPYWPEKVSREISGYNRTLFSLLDESADRCPDLTYTIFNGAEKSFAQVRDTANRVASFLASRGIQKGDRVAIFLPNLPHYPEIYFGILKAGAVCVTCNPLYTASELNYQLNNAGASAVFCMDHPDFYPITVEAIKDTDVKTVVICNIKSYLPGALALIGGLLGKIPKAKRHESGHFMYDDIVKNADPVPPAVDINPDEDLAVIIYTGGTTGVSKGAALTHSNFVFDVMALQEWVWIAPEEGAEPEQPEFGGVHTSIGILPWYHSFGMTVCLLWSCYLTARVVCIPDPRAGNPPFTEVLKAVEKYRVSMIVGVPTIYVAFTNHPHIDKYDLSSVIACSSGGAPLPPEVARQFEAKTGAVIFEGYGLSETSPIATANPSDVKTRKFGSIGFPFPNTDIKILDTETGTKELPKNEDGEIAISGPQVMKGYWQNDEANQQVFREVNGRRFFLTGDIGHIDDDGYIIITDRKKDMILVGGFNVYPREVEDSLFGHPKVQLAAVIGVPDDRSGEKVKAFIQLKEGETCTEEEIFEFAHEHLAGYKRPKLVEFRDELPVSPVGKVLRRVLRDDELKKK